MAFDGLMTRAVAKELRDRIVSGKVEKIYQPETDVLVFTIHTKEGNVKLLMSSGSSHARIHFINEAPVNPPEPYTFCMLLRKHLNAARITDVRQVGCERIMEIDFESLNELGFTVSKKLIVEIMGKHSNIILTDIESGKILDSIKRVGFDVNRVRQLLPGLIYEYPPQQDKVPFDDMDPDTEDMVRHASDGRMIMSMIAGISPAFSTEVSMRGDRVGYIRDSVRRAEDGDVSPRAYFDQEGSPREYYFIPLDEYEKSCNVREYETLSECLEEYYSLKVTSNQAKQKAQDLRRAVKDLLDKKYLKKKRLSEDLLDAKNSDEYRLYGELLTANLHLVKTGMKTAEVISYYDGSTVKIPLDVRKSPSANAQHYFKKYGKAKTAIKEKQVQLDENEEEIIYLESVLAFIDGSQSVDEVEALRQELTESGYLRPRKRTGFKEKKARLTPLKYRLGSGRVCLVGRNNKENDYITLKLSNKGDIWLHTKDIPGSHVLIQAGGDQITEEEIFEAAAIAAFHSKASDSENVPVDHVPIRYVKKPSGAKPGMVIFTNNKTIYVNPKEGTKI
ncbi:MAG: NFACT family protein [Clostridiales bacterium]|nr:NFACT family protein [Clostridiales bacterium]